MAKQIGRLITLVVIILLPLIVVSIYKHPPQEPKEVIVRDTIILHDTITVTKPVPVKVHTVDTMFIHTTDTMNNDVVVALPREEKVYEDDNIRAVVSGYRPSLDSYTVYQPTITIKEKSQLKKWSFGVQIGYGVTKNGFSPYLGIGATYRIN